MIYLVMALYAEAKPLLSAFSMKRQAEETKYALYKNPEDTLALFLMGQTGSVEAAAATAYLCTRYALSEEDILINVGSAAGNGTPGTVYLCHTLRDSLSNRVFHPDILCRHTLQETSLVTLPTILDNGLDPEDTALYDMEGAAIYTAGIRFLSTSSMYFLKVTSDAGSKATLPAKESLEDLFTGALPEITAFLQLLMRFPKPAESPDVEALVTYFCTEIHASKFMEHQIRQLFTYAALSGTDLSGYLSSLTEESLLPTRDKRAGLLLLERVKHDLL